MAKRKHRPSSPADIQRMREVARLRDAGIRAAQRATAGNPATWGLNEQLLELPTANDVAPAAHERGKVRPARRQDLFSQLLAKGAITEWQKGAADRLLGDFAKRMGFERPDVADAGKVDQARGSHELLTDFMLEAGRRIDQVMREVGAADRRLLSDLFEQLLLSEYSVTTWWRGRVQTVTAEENPVGQAARLRGALENLALGYEEIDRRSRAMPGG